MQRARSASIQALWDHGFVAEVTRSQDETTSLFPETLTPEGGRPGDRADRSIAAAAAEEPEEPEQPEQPEQPGPDANGQEEFANLTSFLQNMARRMSVQKGGRLDFLQTEALLVQLQKEDEEEEERRSAVVGAAAEAGEAEAGEVEAGEEDAEAEAEGEAAAERDEFDEHQREQERQKADRSAVGEVKKMTKEQMLKDIRQRDRQKKEAARAVELASLGLSSSTPEKMSDSFADAFADFAGEADKPKEVSFDHGVDHRKHLYPVRRGRSPSGKRESEAERIVRVTALGSLDSRLHKQRLKQAGIDPEQQTGASEAARRAAPEPYTEAAIGEVCA